MDFIPLENLAELGFGALLIALGMFAIWRAPGIIDRLSAYASERAREKQQEADADHEAVLSAQAHSRTTIDQQARLIDRQHDLMGHEQDLFGEMKGFFAEIVEQQKKDRLKFEDMEAEMAGMRGRIESLLPLEGRVKALLEENQRVRDERDKAREEATRWEGIAKQHVQQIDDCSGKIAELTQRLDKYEKRDGAEKPPPADETAGEEKKAA